MTGGPVPDSQVRRLAGRLPFYERQIRAAVRRSAWSEARELREARVIAVAGAWARDRSRAGLQLRLERALLSVRDDVPDAALDTLAHELLPEAVRVHTRRAP